MPFSFEREQPHSEGSRCDAGAIATDNVPDAPVEQPSGHKKIRNVRFQSRSVWVLGLLGLFGFFAVARAHPHIDMAIRIAWFKATGSLPGIGWIDLLRMGSSGAHFNLPALAETPNPYAAIRNPYTIPEDIAAGSALFQSHCATCHRSNGLDGVGGPALEHRQLVHGNSDWAIFKTVSDGIRGTAMPSSSLAWLERWQLAAYVRLLATQTEAISIPAVETRPVSYDQILSSEKVADAWLTYSGSYDGHRFSPTNQITPANAAGLRLVWMRQYDTSEPSIETTPLVVGKFMFVTVPPNRVEALDANSGNLIWAYDRDLPDHLSLCCGYVNRGLAVLGDKLFLGTLDAHLVALDMNTGKVSWDVEIADYKDGYSITGAPLALKNFVITGVAGGEFGIRGFVEARDASTGREIWRFDTIPQPGQPKADTWNGNSWKTGGGPTWLTGTFDPDSNIIYWPTGNPSPNFEGGVRSGDNLYTNSVVALDADHGTLRWHFQFSPHDVFDWDATQIPVLLDGTVAGKRQHLLAQANRNGFFYVLDATTGDFKFGEPFAKVTWAESLDSQGRPVANAEQFPTEKGTTVFPGGGGATNWESPSYSPATGLFYIPALDWGGIFFAGHSEHRPGELFLGGSFEFFPKETSRGTVRAVDPITGKVKWEYRNPATSVGGLLSTGGGVVFGSQGKIFFALDACTGRELWRIGTGGRTVAAPITFRYRDSQMVTIAAGHDILTFAVAQQNMNHNSTSGIARVLPPHP